MQAREVVLVLFGVVERNGADEARQLQVHAVHLVQRHLVELQVVALQPVAQLAHHQLQIELVLVGEAGGVDRLEALEEIRIGLALGRLVRQREIAPAIVVAQVAQDGGELRRVLQRVLPLFGQQLVERIHPGGNAGGRGGGHRRGHGDRAEQARADHPGHQLHANPSGGKAIRAL